MEDRRLTNPSILESLLGLGNFEDLFQIGLLLSVLRMVFVTKPIRQCFHRYLLQFFHIQGQLLDRWTLIVCGLHYQLQDMDQ